MHELNCSVCQLSNNLGKVELVHDINLPNVPSLPTNITNNKNGKLMEIT